MPKLNSPKRKGNYQGKYNIPSNPDATATYTVEPNLPTREWEKEFDKKIGTRKSFTMLGRTMESQLAAADLYDQIIDFIASLLSDQKKQMIHKLEGMKKSKLYHWRNCGDIDGTDEFSEGMVGNYKDAPIVADGSSCEFVWNKALSDAIKEIE